MKDNHRRKIDRQRDKILDDLHRMYDLIRLSDMDDDTRADFIGELDTAFTVIDNTEIFTEK